MTSIQDHLLSQSRSFEGNLVCGELFSTEVVDFLTQVYDLFESWENHGLLEIANLDEKQAVYAENIIDIWDQIKAMFRSASSAFDTVEDAVKHHTSLVKAYATNDIKLADEATERNLTILYTQAGDLIADLVPEGYIFGTYLSKDSQFRYGIMKLTAKPL